MEGGWTCCVASMRPRVFPAEDVRFLEARLVVGLASMRPRVFPAEDLCYRPLNPPEKPLASMRPRVFPAEDCKAVSCVP